MSDTVTLSGLEVRLAHALKWRCDWFLDWMGEDGRCDQIPDTPYCRLCRKLTLFVRGEETGEK
jgi:hypothetical protein